MLRLNCSLNVIGSHSDRPRLAHPRLTSGLANVCFFSRTVGCSSWFLVQVTLTTDTMSDKESQGVLLLARELVGRPLSGTNLLNLVLKVSLVVFPLAMCVACCQPQPSSCTPFFWILFCVCFTFRFVCMSQLATNIRCVTCSDLLSHLFHFSSKLCRTFSIDGKPRCKAASSWLFQVISPGNQLLSVSLLGTNGER